MQLRHTKPSPATVIAPQDEVQLLRDQLTQLQIALNTHSEMRQTLEESDARLRELVNRVRTGIYRVRANGSLILVNKALLQLFGASDLDPRAVEAAGKIEGFRTGAAAWSKLVEEVENAGEIVGHETCYFRRDGAVVHVRESARAVCDAAGRTLYCEGVVEDMTPLRRAEALGRDSHRVLESLAGFHPVDEILTQIAKLVANQWSGSACLIFRRGPHLPFLAAHSELGEQAVTQIRRDGSSLSQPAIETGRLRYSRLPFSHPLSAEYGGVWSVPLVLSDRALAGCLTALQRFARTPAPDEVLSLETAARLASLALEQHKLHHPEQAINYDNLTQLPTRNLLQERLALALDRARVSGHRVGLLSLDLDNFKLINDRFGPSKGDSVLQQVAFNLARESGADGFLSRHGGDEFSLVMPRIQNPDEITAFAERVLDCVAQTAHSLPDHSGLSASIGVAIYPEDGEEATVLQGHADSAVFVAKSQGRNTWCRHQPTETAVLPKRIDLESTLRRGLKESQFQLFYQPQFDASNTLHGFEALLRWNHPSGLLTPDSFLPLAERSGLIVPLGEWVIGEAARQIALWRDTCDISVSVNVSALQFQGLWLPSVVEQKLRASGIPAECLSIELTESILMANAQETTEQLKAIRELGVKVAIDDFGTGYSSLSYLQRLPVDLLKIDRSFVHSLGRHDHRAKAVVRAVVALGQACHLKVIAEGVETREQFQELKELGADLFQGYLFGRPMPACAATASLLS